MFLCILGGFATALTIASAIASAVTFTVASMVAL
jgi:hypothetical protein